MNPPEARKSVCTCTHVRKMPIAMCSQDRTLKQPENNTYFKSYEPVPVLEEVNLEGSLKIHIKFWTLKKCAQPLGKCRLGCVLLGKNTAEFFWMHISPDTSQSHLDSSAYTCIIELSWELRQKENFEKSYLLNHLLNFRQTVLI